MLVGKTGFMLRQIQLELADAELRRPLAAVELAPAEERAHPGHELGHGEGLRHVVVRPDLEPEHPVDLAVLRRQHQDRDRAFLAQAPADLDPGETGQHQVEDEQVVWTRASLLEGVVSVVDRLDLEAFGLQGVLDRLGDRRLVLDDQDPLRHQPRSFALGTTTRTRVPAPGSDSSSIVPPSPRTASSAIARPRPKPSVPFEER